MSKEAKKFHPSDGGIVSQPIWKQSHLQKVVVSGKIMGKKILLEKIKFSSVFGKSDLWAPVKCCWRDVLSGVMGYERMLLWRKFPINCVHPTHRKCKIFFENTNFYPFLCILPFYRVFPNHKGFQSNDHLGYIAPIMPHRSNIKYIFVQPSSSLKNKPNKYLMVVSRRVLRQLTLRAFL